MSDDEDILREIDIPQEWITSICPIGFMDALLKTPIGIWIARYNANPSYESLKRIYTKWSEYSPDTLGISVDSRIKIHDTLYRIVNAFDGFQYECYDIKNKVWMEGEDMMQVLEDTSDWGEFKRILKEKGKPVPVIDLLELQLSVGGGFVTKNGITTIKEK